MKNAHYGRVLLKPKTSITREIWFWTVLIVVPAATVIAWWELYVKR